MNIRTSSLNESAIPPPNPLTNSPNDPIMQHLNLIASCLNVIDMLVADVALLKAQVSQSQPVDCTPNKGRATKPSSGTWIQGKSHWKDKTEEDLDSPWWLRNP